MHSHEPNETSAETHDAVSIDLTRSGSSINLENSIALLHDIHGSNAYLRRLDLAARELYEKMASDDRISQLSKTNVQLPGGMKGTMPRFPRKPTQAKLDALRSILHSLSHAASHPLTRKGGKEQRNECVAIPMAVAAYGKGNEYDLSYRAMQAVVLALGLLKIDPVGDPALHVFPGFTFDGKGRRTRIVASHSFKSWMLCRKLIFPMHPKGRKKRHSLANKSILWRSRKMDNDGVKVKDEKDMIVLDREPVGDETIIPAVNKRLSEAKIKCDLQDYVEYQQNWDYRRGRSKLRTGSGKIYRVFSETDGYGGRLFSHWVQYFPKDLRNKHLTINGQQTVELDYGSMQLCLLYATAGISAPGGDLYDPDGLGKLHRERMKMVLTKSIGCPTRSRAIRAISKQLRDDKVFKDDLAERLYKAFWALHPAVCPHGKSNEAAWGRLQYAESQIALRVLRYLEERKIIVIPIHDSFVVQERYGEKLRNAMANAFSDFFPNTPVQIK